jgi:hypothetical protein
MATRTRLIALNINSGAFVAVMAIGPVRILNLQEDDAATRQGLTLQSYQDGFVSTNNYATTAEPINLPDVLRNPLYGALIGMNAQGTTGSFNARAADTLVKIKSLTSTVTTVRVVEND